MDDTEGIQFPGARSILEPTVIKLRGPGATMSGVCDPDRNGRGKKKKKPPTKKQGKKSSKKGTKKKKK